MESATERRRRFVERARLANLDWTFFPAMTELHDKLMYNEASALVAKGRLLREGEIGCYSSHYAAWLHFYEESLADQLIILEDDVFVDWNYLSKLAQTDLASEGINYLRLYFKTPAKYRIVRRQFLERTRFVVELRGYAFGTQGYALTRAGAFRFLQRFRHISRPIDDQLDRSWEHGLPNLSLFPFPVIEESTPSTIGDYRFEKSYLPPHLRFRYHALRALDRTKRKLQTFTGYGLHRRFG